MGRKAFRRNSRRLTRAAELRRRMSALPPKADIGTQPRNVCSVPKADIGAIREQPQGRRDSGGREAGIKLVAHLCRLGSKRYAPEQLKCLSSRNNAVEAEVFSATLRRPPERCKMHRCNSN